MTELLKNERQHFLIQFEASLEAYLKSFFSKGNSDLKIISESIWYSLSSSGKRFRPFLSYLILKLNSDDFSRIKSWALAVEFIHTYSLIHDDLPCMDNDDFRRGLPTNHKVFGDDIALLAGDSLISEAFRIISSDSTLSAEIRLQLIHLISEKIGPEGMVGGQVLDMKVKAQTTIEQLKQIHRLKTGFLIEAAAIGAAVILGFSAEQVRLVSDFSLNLGLAFQIKDDLLDFNSEQQDFKSFTSLLGREKALVELNKYSDSALDILKKFAGSQTHLLIDLVNYNRERLA